MHKRIHIIDDEPDMIKIATDLLQTDGFIVSSSSTSRDGLKKIRLDPPDLLLLDVRLPDIDGYEVCKQIKSDPKIRHLPVIMVSVKSEETDVVVGLEMGAEDYISKPFRRRELLARVKTALRRVAVPEAQRILSGSLTLDFGSYTVKNNDKPVPLTPKEFELLAFFVKMEGRILTRSTISEAVWGMEFTHSSRTIDVHVDQIRKKLGRIGDNIVSLKGIGYRYELDE